MLSPFAFRLPPSAAFAFRLPLSRFQELHGRRWNSERRPAWCASRSLGSTLTFDPVARSDDLASSGIGGHGADGSNQRNASRSSPTGPRFGACASPAWSYASATAMDADTRCTLQWRRSPRTPRNTLSLVAGVKSPPAKTSRQPGNEIAACSSRGRKAMPRVRLLLSRETTAKSLTQAIPHSAPGPCKSLTVNDGQVAPDFVGRPPKALLKPESE